MQTRRMAMDQHRQQRHTAAAGPNHMQIGRIGKPSGHQRHTAASGADLPTHAPRYSQLGGGGREVGGGVNFKCNQL